MHPLAQLSVITLILLMATSYCAKMANLRFLDDAA